MASCSYVRQASMVHARPSKLTQSLHHSIGPATFERREIKCPVAATRCRHNFALPKHTVAMGADTMDLRGRERSNLVAFVIIRTTRALHNASAKLGKSHSIFRDEVAEGMLPLQSILRLESRAF